MSHNRHHANDDCRRQIEMSPLRLLEISLPAAFLGIVKLAVDDGFGDAPQRGRPYGDIAWPAAQTRSGRVPRPHTFVNAH